MTQKHTFTATIQNAGGGGAFVEVPFDVEAAFGSKKPKVKALIEGVPYRGTLTGGTLLHFDHSKMQQVYLDAAHSRGVMVDREAVGSMLEELESELPMLSRHRALSL